MLMHLNYISFKSLKENKYQKNFAMPNLKYNSIVFMQNTEIEYSITAK